MFQKLQTLYASFLSNTFIGNTRLTFGLKQLTQVQVRLKRKINIENERIAEYLKGIKFCGY